jgi:hypothetical protein
MLDPSTLGTGQTSQPTPNIFDMDPGVLGARAAENLGLPSIDAQTNSLVAQRLAQYGDPLFASQAGFGLDPQAAAFARQNYLSGNAELSRIDKSHQLARQAIINQLASHGILFSGDTGYKTGLEDQGYGNNVYDAQQRVLADLLGYRTSGISQKSALTAATTAARENAWTNYVNNPQAYAGLLGQPGASTSNATVNTQLPAAKPPMQTSVRPPAKPSVAHSAVVKALINPYTTGQKRFG